MSCENLIKKAGLSKNEVNFIMDKALKSKEIKHIVSKNKETINKTKRLIEKNIRSKKEENYSHVLKDVEDPNLSKKDADKIIENTNKELVSTRRSLKTKLDTQLKYRKIKLQENYDKIKELEKENTKRIENNKQIKDLRKKIKIKNELANVAKFPIVENKELINKLRYLNKENEKYEHIPNEIRKTKENIKNKINSTAKIQSLSADLDNVNDKLKQYDKAKQELNKHKELKNKVDSRTKVLRDNLKYLIGGNKNINAVDSLIRTISDKNKSLVQRLASAAYREDKLKTRREIFAVKVNQDLNIIKDFVNVTSRTTKNSLLGTNKIFFNDLAVYMKNFDVKNIKDKTIVKHTKEWINSRYNDVTNKGDYISEKETFFNLDDDKLLSKKSDFKEDLIDSINTKTLVDRIRYKLLDSNIDDVDDYKFDKAMNVGILKAEAEKNFGNNNYLIQKYINDKIVEKQVDIYIKNMETGIPKNISLGILEFKNDEYKTNFINKYSKYEDELNNTYGAINRIITKLSSLQITGYSRLTTDLLDKITDKKYHEIYNVNQLKNDLTQRYGDSYLTVAAVSKTLQAVQMFLVSSKALTLPFSSLADSSFKMINDSLKPENNLNTFARGFLTSIKQFKMVLAGISRGYLGKDSNDLYDYHFKANKIVNEFLLGGLESSSIKVMEGMNETSPASKVKSIFNRSLDYTYNVLESADKHLKYGAFRAEIENLKNPSKGTIKAYKERGFTDEEIDNLSNAAKEHGTDWTSIKDEETRNNMTLVKNQANMEATVTEGLNLNFLSNSLDPNLKSALSMFMGYYGKAIRLFSEVLKEQNTPLERFKIGASYLSVMSASMFLPNYMYSLAMNYLYNIDEKPNSTSLIVDSSLGVFSKPCMMAYGIYTGNQTGQSKLLSNPITSAIQTGADVVHLTYKKLTNDYITDREYDKMVNKLLSMLPIAGAPINMIRRNQ